MGELSTQSERFRQRWASRDVRHHRSGRKRLRDPVVDQLDLDFEAMELPSEPGTALNICTAAEGTPTSDALKLLASWVDQDEILTEQASSTRACSEYVLNSQLKPARGHTFAGHVGAVVRWDP